MDFYKKAVFMKLRINTSQGLLSIEQVCDLSLTRLATILKDIRKNLKS